MKVFYRCISTMIIVLFTTISFSQTETPTDLSMLNNTPNVSNLINSTVYQDVSLSTGLPGFSVPIFTLSKGSISVPVTLGYNYSGFQPQQDASWVGMGWNLNAGGVIARTLFNKQGIDPVMKLRALANHINLDSTIMANFLGSQDFLFGTDYNFCSYSFANHVGNFIYHSDTSVSRKDSAYTFPHDRLRITQGDVVSDTFGNGFRIVDDNGITYNFNDLEVLNSGNPPGTTSGERGIGSSGTGSGGSGGTSGSTLPPPPQVTAYYLSSIISCDKKDTINFNYVYDLYNVNHSDTFNASIYNNIAGKLLTSIETRDTKIQFIMGGDTVGYVNTVPYLSRKDINGVYPWLSSIQVTDKITGKVIKNVSFSYGYFGKGNNSDSIWLKLQKLTEQDSNDSTVGSYIFNYQSESDSFTSKLNGSIDYLGYSNDSGHTSSAITGTQIITGNPAIPYGSLSNTQWPVFSKTVKGALNKVVFPTGGTISYTYESNDCNDGYYRALKPATTKTYTLSNTGSGTVADTFLFHIPYGNYIQPINFTYTGSAIVTDLYDSSTDVETNIVYNSGWKKDGGFKSDKYLITLGASSSISFTYYDSVVPITSFQVPGIRLHKTVMTDSIGQNSITKTYTYQSNGYSSGTFMPGLLNYFPNSIYQNEEFPFKAIDTGDNSFKKCAAVSDINLCLQGASKYNFYYHKVTENTVSTTDTLRSEYNFDLMPRVTRATDVALVKKVTYKHVGTTFIPEVVDSSASTLFYGSGYLNYWKRPVQSFETTYDSNSDSIKGTTVYQYDTTTTYLSGTIAQNSDNSYLITRLKHPENYTNGVLGNAFINHYVLAPVLEQQQWKVYPNGDTVMLGGSITVYDTVLFKPVKQFSLEIATPLTALSNETKDGTGHFTSLISDSNYVDKGDLVYNTYTGKLVRFNKAVGQYQYLIWGYDNTLPIAQIISPVIDTASAYSSFEINSDGGWVMSSASRDTAQSVTGKQSYSLSSNTISRNGLSSTSTYTLSYWRNSTSPLSINGTTGSARQGMTVLGWTYFEHTISGVSSISISGSGNIDELRLYPQGAMMNTGTYRPLIGISSKCDASNRITYFEYDRAGRLRTVRNQHREILKTSDYQYINK